MKKLKLFYWLFPLIAIFVLSGCSFSKKNAASVERKEELNKPIAELIRDREEFECFITGANPVARVMAKNNIIKIDGFRNNLIKSKSGDGGSLLGDGDKITFWELKKGVRYNLTDLQKASSEGDGKASETLEGISPINWAAKLDKDKVKYTCKKASIPDEHFKIPEELEITDFTLTKEAKKDNREENPTNSGANTPSREKEKIVEDPEVENLQ